MRLKLPHVKGRSEMWNISSQEALNHRIKHDGAFEREKPVLRLGRKLKKIAEEICADITGAQPLEIPGHLCRIGDFRTICDVINSLGVIPSEEWRTTEQPIGRPITIADWLECLALTKKQHRGPCFINPNQESQERIERKVDFIAGALARTPALIEMLAGIREGEL